MVPFSFLCVCLLGRCVVYVIVASSIHIPRNVIYRFLFRWCFFSCDSIVMCGEREKKNVKYIKCLTTISKKCLFWRKYNRQNARMMRVCEFLMGTMPIYLILLVCVCQIKSYMYNFSGNSLQEINFSTKMTHFTQKNYRKWKQNGDYLK